MIVLAWILLISIPILWGLGIMTIAYWKKQDATIRFADCFVCGFLGGIGVSELGHCIGFFGQQSLSVTGKILFLFVLFFSALMLMVSLFGILKRPSQYKSMAINVTVPKALPLAVIGVFFLQSLFIFCRNPIPVQGDIMVETVQSFLAEDGIYRVMPLTGKESIAGMPLRYTILCLPTLYAVLADKFGLDVQLVVCHMVPILVLGISYLSYFQLSGSLFGASKLRERYVFLIAVGILFTFSGQAVFLDG